MNDHVAEPFRSILNEAFKPPVPLLEIEWTARQRAVMEILVNNFGEWIPNSLLIEAFHGDRSIPRHARRNFQNCKSGLRLKVSWHNFTIESERWARTRLVRCPGPRQ